MLSRKLLLPFVIIFGIEGCAANPHSSTKVNTMSDNMSGHNLANNLSHYENGTFHNTSPRNSMSFKKRIALGMRLLTEQKVNTIPDMAIPVRAITQTDLNALSNDNLYVVKLGHSSMLLKVYGEYWLIDPVFSERASPVQFAGPKRFHQPPINLEDLPPIDKVLISHNHYDHLDKASIKILAQKAQAFFVPIGVDKEIENWGVARSKITTFDWWQEQQTDSALVAFTPAQHFSGRGLADGDTTLWGSWVIKTPTHSFFFSGDSGYFAGFKEIGERFGPFDITMLETGAYDNDWSDIHMTPEQSVQAHMDLKGKIMIPVHNGTFDLAFHTWHDPFDRVTAAAEKNNVVLSTPEFGQIFSISDAAIINPWWQK